MIMSAVRRIPVTEPVGRDLAEMRSAGQTYTDLLAEMIEDQKKASVRGRCQEGE
jgi:predicted CopG family antitoxin